MKVTIKILILMVSITLAIGGVMIYAKTRIEPPIATTFIDQYSNNLNEEIVLFKNLDSQSSEYLHYATIVSKIKIYQAESKISEDIADEMLYKVVSEYAPLFIEHSYKAFSKSVWHESDHNVMIERIAHLRSLRVDHGMTSPVASYEADLSKIERTIINYRKAKTVASYAKFNSISDANAKIQEAEKYRTMDPLSNCTDLTNQLAKVKINIGNSHYLRLVLKVDQMACYSKMTEAEFNSLMSDANSMIQEYDNNCSMYGHNAKTTESLKQNVEKYCRDAMEFFAREEINISTNSQWISMTSPNESYRAYQSSSNYNRPNSEATMYFTIKGYNTFTFYIRSDGESDCDYVMVGIDSKPTRNSNYADTKGAPSAGTNLDDYKVVTFNNLSKLSTYTIYVTYTKNISRNDGTDRGYVLIPYENN